MFRNELDDLVETDNGWGVAIVAIICLRKITQFTSTIETILYWHITSQWSFYAAYVIMGGSNLIQLIFFRGWNLVEKYWVGFFYQTDMVLMIGLSNST